MIKRSDKIGWEDTTHLGYSLNLIDAELARLGAEIIVVDYRYAYLYVNGKVYDAYERKDMVQAVCASGLSPVRSAWKDDMGRALAQILNRWGLPNGKMVRVDIPIYANEPSIERQERRRLAKAYVCQTLTAQPA